MVGRRIRELGRSVLSLAPLVGLVGPPGPRPQGISAIVRVRDEEEWLEPAIRSIVGFADQIVVGDNGSQDRTPAILQALSRDFPELVEVLSLPDADICLLTNALVARTRFRWIVRWDADFVAQTNGPAGIDHLRRWLLGLDPRRYYMVYLTMVEVAGDFWHQDPVTPYRTDAHCWTASPSVRYVYDAQGYESPRLPRWYAVRRWETPCFYHVNIKSDERQFMSYLWKRYLRDPHRSRYAGLREYTERFCLERFGHRDASRAAQQWMTEYVKGLVPFDAGRYPGYPELLRPHLACPRYRIVYRDGQILGRETRETSEIMGEA